MRALHAAEAVLFATGLAIGAACAKDSNAQPAERTAIVVDDTSGIRRLLTLVRGSDPLVCEMTTRSADMRGSWSMWGPISGDPLTMDSTAAALLGWIQRTHNDPSVVPLLGASMRDDDGCVRRVAGALLSRVKHPLAVRTMLETLDDRKVGTREAGAFALGMAETATAIDPLIARLRDQSAQVRRAAVWALGQMEAKRAVPTLLDLLARDPDAKVRQTAAWAIGSIH